jgi:LysM repeat protein
VASARTLYHRVRKGETLSSIAAHYAVSAQELKGWNVGMNPKMIAGQRLRVISDIASAGTRSKQRRTKAVRPAPVNKTALVKPASSRGKAPPANRL